ncbi:hypothetical protein AB6A40_006789 [Gnathostoma spinigerum]|uniref:Apple domain-containing protein n=1 Tax=Gnathostoma spinigerum TaxID=75299 RepID=A0ABD6EKJ9_9BILA
MPKLWKFFTFVVALLSVTRTTSGSEKCFVNGPGATVESGEYRREYDITFGLCALLCRQESCCLAFEWIDDQCTLKGYSLSGSMVKMEKAYFGICFDSDESLPDHIIEGLYAGPPIHGLTLTDCIEYCEKIESAQMFSWTPLNVLVQDDSIGECRCIQEIAAVRLHFGSSSGALPKLFGNVS